VRVVFDCAASYQDRLLNNELLTGPDLLQLLFGVLLRFRLGWIAFTSDIQLIFYQVYIANEDQDRLQFLWWPHGNTSQPPEENCMVVHLFGAKSSLSCANFILLQTAEDNLSDLSPTVLDTVKYNFYVDNCLKSVDSEAEAIGLINE